VTYWRNKQAVPIKYSRRRLEIKLHTAMNTMIEANFFLNPDFYLKKKLLSILGCYGRQGVK